MLHLITKLWIDDEIGVGPVPGRNDDTCGGSVFEDNWPFRVEVPNQQKRWGILPMTFLYKPGPIIFREVDTKLLIGFFYFLFRSIDELFPFFSGDQFENKLEQ